MSNNLPTNQPISSKYKTIYEFISTNEDNFVYLISGEVFLGRYLKEEEFDQNMVKFVFNPKTSAVENFQNVDN